MYITKQKEMILLKQETPRTEQEKNELKVRLNRIEGQVRGIKGMIEKDTHCDDILTQVSAVQSALNGVGKLLLEHHMRTCVVNRIENGETEVIEELLKTFSKLLK